MPYIDQDSRDGFVNPRGEDILRELGDKIENCGELNYVVTVLCHQYLKNKGLRYQNINDIVGALEGCKLELYRRVASNYEDEKIILNGDVKEI